jgi:hypothetical protein
MGPAIIGGPGLSSFYRSASRMSSDIYSFRGGRQGASAENPRHDGPAEQHRHLGDRAVRTSGRGRRYEPGPATHWSRAPAERPS